MSSLHSAEGHTEPPKPVTKNFAGPRAAFSVAVILSLIAAMLPFWLYNMIAWPISLFLTYAHEMGHGLTALLMGGTFHEFHMQPDGSGVAFTSGDGYFFTALVCAGGLVAPAVLAAILFRVARNSAASRVALMLLGLSSLIAALAVVRNPFGFAFVIGLGAVLLLVSALHEQFARLFTAFLAVQLAICVYIRSDYLFNGSPGTDVAQMANALLLPYWFWGFLCAAFSAMVLFVGARSLWRSAN